MTVWDWRDGKQTTVTSKDKHYRKLSEKQTDPQTSHDAAHRSAKFRVTQSLRILNMISMDPYNWTSADIGAACGLTTEQVARRLPELAAQGLIERVKENGDDSEYLIYNGFTVWRYLA